MAEQQHHDRSQQGSAFYVDFPWRTGRKVARNVYAIVDGEPSDEDVLIGNFDTGALARAAVAAHNLCQARTRGEPEGVDG